MAQLQQRRLHVSVERYYWTIALTPNSDTHIAGRSKVNTTGRRLWTVTKNVIIARTCRLLPTADPSSILTADSIASVTRDLRR